MDKISPIKKNILQYLDFKGVTKVDFCEKTGISYTNMKGKGLVSEIGGAQIGKILSVYSDINPEWLITGKGEMLRNPEPKKEENNSDENYIDKLLTAKDELISSQKVNIEVLLRYNKKLEEDLKEVKSNQEPLTQTN